MLLGYGNRGLSGAQSPSSKNHSQLKDGRAATQRGTKLIDDHTATQHNCNENSNQNSVVLLALIYFPRCPSSTAGSGKHAGDKMVAAVERTDTEGVFPSRSLAP